MMLHFVVLVHFSELVESHLNAGFLQRANAWLQRRIDGKHDELFLVGLGFQHEAAFKTALKSYGLESANVAVIPPEVHDLEGAVEALVEAWIHKKHRGSIPIADWRNLVPEACYPLNNWWWVGVEARNDELSSLAAVFEAICPPAFQAQALTWVNILVESAGLSPFGGSQAEHEAALSTVALARWLTGFDAAAENNFYDFSASEALAAAGIDPLRLGFETGLSFGSDLRDRFEESDESSEDLADACLLACLESRTPLIRSSLSAALGGDSLLFWSLYRSIWPKLQQPIAESFDGLLSLRHHDMSELEGAWRFVTEGWIEFSEE